VSEVRGLLVYDGTYNGADQCDEWFWDCPFEHVWVVGRYLVPFVEVKQLGGGSNNWMGKVNLIVLEKKLAGA
jgi:hypothetical protein